MKQLQQQFTEGLNKDIDVRLLKPTQYRDARNIRITSVEVKEEVRFLRKGIRELQDEVQSLRRSEKSLGLLIRMIQQHLTENHNYKHNLLDEITYKGDNTYVITHRSYDLYNNEEKYNIASAKTGQEIFNVVIK